MLIRSSPFPTLRLDGSDRDWILSLASAIHELDRDATLRNLVELLVAKYVKECDPNLEGEELEEAVYEELYERLENARSLSKLEDLLSVIRDVDPDFEMNMFGDKPDRLEIFLASAREIRESVFSVLDGLTSYIQIYPERIQADVDHFLNPPDTWTDEDEIQDWREKELAGLMIGRRDAMIAKLVDDCVNEKKRDERLSNRNR